MGYISHNLRKIVHNIGNYTLGQTYVQAYGSREIPTIEITAGLDEESHYEIELHELFHQIFRGLSEYKNRILTRLMLLSLGKVPKYH